MPKAVGGGPLCTRPSAGLRPHWIVSLQGVGRKDSRDAGLGRVRRTEPPLLALPPPGVCLSHQTHKAFCSEQGWSQARPTEPPRLSLEELAALLHRKTRSVISVGRSLRQKPGP